MYGKTIIWLIDDSWNQHVHFNYYFISNIFSPEVFLQYTYFKKIRLNPLSANPTKWWNILKQIVGNSSVFRTLSNIYVRTFPPKTVIGFYLFSQLLNQLPDHIKYETSIKGFNNKLVRNWQEITGWCAICRF